MPQRTHGKCFSGQRSPFYTRLADPDFLTANLYILPPADPGCSDEDSGDEDKGTLDNLSRQQLEAEGQVTVWKGDKRVRLFTPDDSDDVTPPAPDQSASQPTPSTSASASGFRRRRTATVVSAAGSSSASSFVSESRQPSDIQHDSTTTATTAAKKRKLEKPVRKWSKFDMPQTCKPSGTIQHSDYSSTDLTPTALFESFFDSEVMQLLAENSNKYALQKGKHGFTTSPTELRLFMAILFTSGYAPLPRRRLYWEPSPDVHNAAVSQAMTRNRFEELMENIHVADNDNLAPNDRMANVRPLFTALNSKFITHFPRQQDLNRWSRITASTVQSSTSVGSPSALVIRSGR